jgi:thiol-disulfide isomerase/thioredoxin
MNFEKIVKDLDTVDVILLLAVVVLMYIAFSRKYDFMDPTPMPKKPMPRIPQTQETPEPVKPHHDKPHHAKPHHAKPHHDKPHHDKHKQPPCGREYDSTMDSNNLMGSPLQDQMLLSSVKPGAFNATGTIDISENMGMNLCDLDKPLTGPGMKVYNSSLGSLTQEVPQNIVNSNNILGYEMSTKTLLDSAQKYDKPTSDKHTSDKGGLPKDRYHVDLVHADWCGFCKKAKPHWEKVKQDHHGQDKLGLPGFFDDHEESKDSHVVGKGKKFEVDGFPTYFLTLVKDGIEQEPIKFNAITYDTILEEIKKHL